MADGKTHAKDSLFLAWPVGISIAVWLGPLPAIWAALGCYAGVVLSPDLDQENWTYSEWVLRKIPIVGLLLSYLMFIYWYPYSKAFRHGHVLTHVPVISTILRVAYFMVVPMAFLWLVDSALLLQLFPKVQYVLPYLFLGLCISDTAHWIRDGFRIWR